MVSLQQVIIMLLDGDEVVLDDGHGKHYEIKLEEIPDAVDYVGATTLLIRADRLGGKDVQ